MSKGSAGLSAELGFADPASLAWEDNLVATALNLSTPEIRCPSIWKTRRPIVGWDSDKISQSTCPSAIGLTAVNNRST